MTMSVSAWFKSELENWNIFTLVVRDWINDSMAFVVRNRVVFLIVFGAVSGYPMLIVFNGPGVEKIDICIYLSWWLFLGVLSSVGLGSGLHTFLLYLGPFIAKTTMAAEECHSLSFATTGPFAFICTGKLGAGITPSILQIMRKVAPESFMWGLGTALGELPPYFVARAAARSGRQVQPIPPRSDEKPKPFFGGLMDRFSQRLHVVFMRFGFMAILLFASIPNPLFDLAGVTCGHFGVPFWTFFGATALGKALFKAGMQSLFIIYMFHEGHLEALLATVEKRLPPSVCDTIDRFFKSSKAQFHGGDPGLTASRPLVAVIWDYILILMLLSFLRSIMMGSVQERRDLMRQTEKSSSTTTSEQDDKEKAS